MIKNDADIECKEMIETKEFSGRVLLSMIMGSGWMAFILIWLFFYASDFHVYQNIAIFLMSILIVGIILGAAWASLGIKYSKEMEMEMMKYEGYRWRLAFSIIMGGGLAVFIIYWLFFNASDYSFFQNLAIIMISVLIICGLLGLAWTIWGMKYRSDMEKELWKSNEFKLRIIFSIIMGFGFLIFLILWFFFKADNYTFYQNIAIFIVAFIIVGGIFGTVWVPWGMKQGKKLENLK
jgi:MFS family permease